MLKNSDRPLGFSLVELMVSLAVGLFIVGGVIGIYASTMRSNVDTLKMTRLNQELRTAMNIMVRDIRRSGYFANAYQFINTGTTPLPFSTLLSVGDTDSDGIDECVLYGYDENSDGDDDGATERSGFRLTVDADNVGVVQMFSSNNLADWICTGSNWQPLTDDRSIDINGLSFTVTPTNIGNVTLNQIQITLTGALINDSNVTRTITESVKLRNDRIN